MVIPTAYIATSTEFRQPNITTLKPISQSGSELVQSPKRQRVAAENCERKHAQVPKENKRTNSQKKEKSHSIQPNISSQENQIPFFILNVSQRHAGLLETQSVFKRPSELRSLSRREGRPAETCTVGMATGLSRTLKSNMASVGRQPVVP